MELIKQVEINIDYILMMVSRLHDEHIGNAEIRLRLEKTITSSPDLRPKRELIEQFIDSLTPESDVHGEWDAFVREQQAKQLEQIIEEEHLRPEETRRFMTRAFQEGQVQEMGTDVSRILPPMPLFSKDKERSRKKETVLEKLKAFFTRFFDISNGNFDA